MSFQFYVFIFETLEKKSGGKGKETPALFQKKLKYKFFLLILSMLNEYKKFECVIEFLS